MLVTLEFADAGGKSGSHSILIIHGRLTGRRYRALLIGGSPVSVFGAPDRY
jgi:hypothetical protein